MKDILPSFLEFRKEMISLASLWLSTRMKSSCGVMAVTSCVCYSGTWTAYLKVWSFFPGRRILYLLAVISSLMIR